MMSTSNSELTINYTIESPTNEIVQLRQRIEVLENQVALLLNVLNTPSYNGGEGTYHITGGK